MINHGIALGIRHIGENRVQELCEKYEGYAPVDLQFIGHLQKMCIRDRCSMPKRSASIAHIVDFPA